MADEKNLKDDEKKGGEFRIPPRTWIIWSAIISSVLLLLMFNKDKLESPSQVLTQYEFTQLVHSNLIAKAYISYDVQNPFLILNQVSGKYYKADKDGNKIVGSDGKPVESNFKAEVHLTEKL